MPNLVRDLMHPGLITCHPTANLGQIAVMLIQHRIHSLYVTDNGDEVVGIVTDFDLLAGEWLSTDEESLKAMRAMTAGELMSAPLNTIEADEPTTVAARRLGEGGFRRLLVVEKGKPAGVISISDFLPLLSSMDIVKRETVADVMSHAMLVCRDDTPITGIARGLADSRYRAVLVVNPMGQPLGLVSGLDLLSCFETEGCDVTRTAAQVMHSIITIHPTASLREAADKMIQHHHHRLVVVDSDREGAMPVGMISSVDIVSEMARPGSVWQV